MNRLVLVLLLLICYTFSAEGQEQTELSGVDQIEQLLNDENWPDATRAIDQQIEALKSAQDFDSLALYVLYIARLAKKDQAPETGKKAGEAFIRMLDGLTKDPNIFHIAHFEFGNYFELQNDYKSAYDQNKIALEYARNIPNVKGATLGLLEGNLGTLSQRQGLASVSKGHHRRALAHYESDPETPLNSYSIVYNSLGGTMWYTSNFDSAMYYYEKGLEVLKKMEQTPRVQYYKPAFLQNNLAAIHGNEGRITEAIQMMLDCIENIEAYIEVETKAVEREDAIRFRLISVENLGGLYQDVGDFQRGYDLLMYAHEEKKKHLPPDGSGQFKSMIFLGRINMIMRNFDEAKYYLDSAIAFIDRIPGDYLWWTGDAHNYLAQVYRDIGETEKARAYFDKAEEIYERSFQGYYDEIGLTFFTNAAAFNAANGDPERGIAQAQKAYNFVVQQQGNQSLSAFRQSVSLADVYSLSGDHKSALSQIEKSLDILKKPGFEREKLIDSLQIEYELPGALLIKAQSQYALQENKDLDFLLSLYADLNQAIQILERRRSISGELSNLTTLIALNQDLFSFSKKIAAELYQVTGEQVYLDRLINLHESGLYNRIRMRLNQQKSLKFTGVPEHIRYRDTRLRNELQSVLIDSEDNTTETLKRFVAANQAREDFLDSLKQFYPDYFQLRYSDIITPIGDIQQQISDQQSVIRYLFVEQDLYALVFSNNSKELIPLNGKKVKTALAQFDIRNPKQEEIAQGLYELHELLWEPLKAQINTTQVIIIPDQELFNLSFELLTPNLVSDLEKWTNDCLLNQYSISYNYSLTLIGRPEKEIGFEHNFVAFSPGFSDEMKSSYQDQLTDSFELDRTYLYLLPQPFSTRLSNQMKKLFGGKSFTEKASTKQAFINHAGQNRVIFVGTHAASDNLNPERSRLIFAKDATLSAQENYLYAYEIYEYDLQSKLTILSGCETGKPSYQSGEGMISLAHAFDYVGSESMLTALWKIDEQSSTEIIEAFLKNLKAGLNKDEALQKAKLQYLETATGRAKLPEYWAGLILMGDANSIEFPEESHRWYWVLALMTLVGVGIYLRIKTRDRP